MSRVRFTADTAPPPSMAHCQLFVLVKVLDKYGQRIPQAAELQRDWGMNRATAYRWRATIKAARGIA